jgi:hypothetical protein
MPKKEHTTNVVMKIYPDGRIEEGNWKMTLKEMQDFVGGPIEMARSKIPRRMIICDEEHGFKAPNPNIEATKLLDPRTCTLDGRLHGNCLLAKG